MTKLNMHIPFYWCSYTLFRVKYIYTDTYMYICIYVYSIASVYCFIPPARTPLFEADVSLDINEFLTFCCFAGRSNGKDVGSTKNCDTTQEKGELFVNDFLDIPKQQINVYL